MYFPKGLSWISGAKLSTPSNQIYHLYALYKYHIEIWTQLSCDHLIQPCLWSGIVQTNEDKKLVVVTPQFEHRLVTITPLNCSGFRATTLYSLPYILMNTLYFDDLFMLIFMVFCFHNICSQLLGYMILGIVYTVDEEIQFLVYSKNLSHSSVSLHLWVHLFQRLQWKRRVVVTAKKHNLSFC